MAMSTRIRLTRGDEEVALGLRAIEISSVLLRMASWEAKGLWAKTSGTDCAVAQEPVALVPLGASKD